MASNARTSGKWASKTTFKCVIINTVRGTRIPFYSHTAHQAKIEATQYWKINHLRDDQHTLLEPVEVFKRGIPYNTAVSTS